MKIQYLSILFLLILFAQSCTKDPSCGDTSDIVNSYNISADDKSKIPFKGTDTLVYISDVGDTAKLIGTGKMEYIDQVKKQISGNADCPKYQVDNKETISMEYNGSNNELNKIEYELLAGGDKTRLNYMINSYFGSLAPYYFNESSFYTSSVTINNKNYVGRLINLLDSVDLLYNKDYGFLKIEFKGGKIWLLKI